MRITLLAAFALALLGLAPAAADERFPVDVNALQRLQLSDEQVQSLFSLILGKAPYILDEKAGTESLVSELAPQALQILTPEQKDMLQRLAPTEEMEHFGSMNRDERKRFILRAADSLVHPSKKEWLRRVEEMTE